jgi:hypothetical protein
VGDVAADQVEQRGLARTVGPDDRAQVARGHRQVHAIHGLHAAKVLAQALCL